MSDSNSVLILENKWQEVLDVDSLPKIGDKYKREVTAMLLENEEKFLREAATTIASNAAHWDPVLIQLVRRLTPRLIAYDICGLQAMNGPTSLVFALRPRYTDSNGAEAWVNEADTSHSGAAGHSGDDPWDQGFATGAGQTTATAEADSTWNSMSVTIEKTSVTAKTRQLRADYSLEIAQDLRAVRGLDAEAELSNILTSQIIAEINREIVRTIYAVSKAGAAFATSPGTFDLQTDADGRHFVERVKGLMFAIERDANAIGHESRMGKGNLIITTPDVASALAIAGILVYAPSLENQTQLEVDETGVTLAGRLGRFKVFIDPYLGSDGYVVGYKGPNQYDAGLFYCPYVPLQMVKATSVDTFQPAIGFKTRYGIIANPFTTLSANSNVYYRKAKITNLL